MSYESISRAALVSVYRDFIHIILVNAYIDTSNDLGGDELNYMTFCICELYSKYYK